MNSTGDWVDWTRDQYEDETELMRSTRLKQYIFDPNIYNKIYNTKEIVEKTSSALDIGQALHSLVFDNETPWVVFEGSKVHDKKAWELTKKFHKGKVIVTREDEDNLYAMRERLRLHPLAGPLLFEQGFSEHTILWTHGPSGVECKARIDWLKYDHTIVDLKTIGKPGEEFFANQVSNFGYDVSAAFYSQARDSVLDEPNTDADFKYVTICVKPETDFQVRVCTLPSEALEIGDWHVDDGLIRFARSMESGKWQGPMDLQDQLIQLPAWYWAKGKTLMGFKPGV